MTDEAQLFFLIVFEVFSIAIYGILKSSIQATFLQAPKKNDYKFQKYQILSIIRYDVLVRKCIEVPLWSSFDVQEKCEFKF